MVDTIYRNDRRSEMTKLIHQIMYPKQIIYILVSRKGFGDYNDRYKENKNMWTIKSKNSYNETKYLILRTLFNTDRYLTPVEIARKCGLTLQAVKSALTRLYRWRYIWRSIDRRKTRNWYIYCRLKQKGLRVYLECNKRKTIEELTNCRVPLNLKKPIPHGVYLIYRRLKKIDR